MFLVPEITYEIGIYFSLKIWYILVLKFQNWMYIVLLISWR